MERNKPYLAFEAKNAIIKDGCYVVPIEQTRTLYDGRYCAVAGFFFAEINGEICVLANRRGEGAPDFKGYWNCPCGFLERGENSIDGILRETFEECGVIIPKKYVVVANTQTEPSECNNGNVTIHHLAYLLEKPKTKEADGGEKDEVTEVRWIPVREVKEYPWAFGHEKTIMKYYAQIRSMEK